MLCPCESNLVYEECCKPFHESISKPKTAQSLMRSRFSAFCLKLVDYLIQTTHPNFRTKTLKQDLESSFEQVTYTHLEIIKTWAGMESDKIGKVEFKAHYTHNGKTNIHHELSRFKRYKREWVYTDYELQ